MDWLSLASTAASSLAPLVNDLVAVSIPVVGGFVLKALRQHNVNTTYYEALGRAGGAALNSLAASGKPTTDKAALAAAALEGVKYLADNAAKTMIAKGVTSPEQAAAVVAAEAVRQAFASATTPTPAVGS